MSKETGSKANKKGVGSTEMCMTNYCTSTQLKEIKPNDDLLTAYCVLDIVKAIHAMQV